MKNKKPIGLIIKELSDEKKLSTSKLSTLTGKSRQYVYNSFAKIVMDEDELNLWAKALNMQVYDLQKAWDESILLDNQNSFGQEIAERFEKLFREQSETIEFLKRQLEFKDKIIATALNIQTEASGKSNGVHPIAVLEAA